MLLDEKTSIPSAHLWPIDLALPQALIIVRACQAMEEIRGVYSFSFSKLCLHVPQPCHCLAVLLPCSYRYVASTADARDGCHANQRSKGSALQIAEAYKMKKGKILLHDDERHNSRNLTKMIDFTHDHRRSSGRKMSPYSVSATIGEVLFVCCLLIRCYIYSALLL